jgi:hypothetical protein
MHPDADFLMLLTLQIHQGARKLGETLLGSGLDGTTEGRAKVCVYFDDAKRSFGKCVPKRNVRNEENRVALAVGFAIVITRPGHAFSHLGRSPWRSGRKPRQ